MPQISMFKMPFDTKHFNMNQKVWVQSSTGAQAAGVYGKFRGKGRYVYAWVNWGGKNKIPPTFQDIEVTDSFKKQVMGY